MKLMTLVKSKLLLLFHTVYDLWMTLNSIICELLLESKKEKPNLFIYFLHICIRNFVFKCIFFLFYNLSSGAVFAAGVKCIIQYCMLAVNQMKKNNIFREFSYYYESKKMFVVHSRFYSVWIFIYSELVL